MSKLYLFNYNNYFNRIIKRGVTLSDYGTPIYSLSNTNFQENDGVTTSHVVNYNAYDGDYIVITDDNDVIKSRWFVVENVKQRGGQHSLSLRRDLIADYYNSIINEPALINRAIVSDSNPLIFNSEGFSFNQIKKDEILLKDKTLSPWYYIYLNKNTPKISDTFVLDDVAFDEAISVGIDDNGSPFKAGTYSFVDSQNYKINYDPNTFVGQMSVLPIPGYNRYSTMMGFLSTFYTTFNNADYIQAGYILANAFMSKYNDLNTALNQYITNDLITESQYQSLRSKDGIIVKATSGGVSKLYLVKINIVPYTRSGYAQPQDNLYNVFDSTIRGTNLVPTGGVGSYGSQTFEYSYTEYIVTISHTEITTGSVAWEIDVASHIETIDAPYNIIAIPYYSVTIEDSVHIYNCKENTNRMLVNAIISKLGTQYIHDVQLLPYFAYPNLKVNYTQLTPGFISDVLLYDENLQPAIDPKCFVGINEDTYNSAGIFYIQNSSFSFNIEKVLTIPNRSSKPGYNTKIANEVDTYRLISPNYNGNFEFSVAKNNGVEYFNVDVTLRPYNPYIHVNPNFKGIYGNDFNDARGLICSGDFSLPIITDAFTQYEYQNKNYQLIFNRQIQHMDFEFSKARTENLFGAITGTVGAGVSGGLTGGMVGGPLGVGIGAGIGTIASAVGGAVDYGILKERQIESKSLALANYSYQLGNIKALPYSISKVTAFTYNNKLWPFIEIYSATDTEIEMLINKMDYYSMNVNAIGTISGYQQAERKFISANLIRLEDLSVPTHEANEIYDEIMKGVYI